jgi:Predicted metal-dependent hydrolase of the TIM-barrel fold
MVRTLRIDAHQHFWRYRPQDYGWIDDSMPDLKRDFLPEHLEPLLRGHGFDGSVAVQARMVEEETDSLLALARADSSVLAVVGWTDLRAPDVDRRLDARAGEPLLKGYRHQVQDEPSPSAFLDDPAFNRGVEAVLRRGLVYEVLIHARELEAATRLCARHEGALVLDHLGKPDVRRESARDWGARLRPLARLPHVRCKLSGLITEAAWKAWTGAQLVPYMETALELFGPKRLLFGSDWPVCLLSGTYGDVYGLAETALAGLSEHERALVWGGNAASVYNIAPRA